MQNHKQIGARAFDATATLDEVDWRILAELQADARCPYAEVGRRVGLTAPAVAERVRRLEAAGIITGYHAAIDTERLGLSLAAFVRYTVTKATYAQIDQLLRTFPEILECHRVTGDDCYIMRIAVASVVHLEDLINRLTPYGMMITSIILSSTITRRAISPANLTWGASD